MTESNYYRYIYISGIKTLQIWSRSTIFNNGPPIKFPAKDDIFSSIQYVSNAYNSKLQMTIQSLRS